MSRMNQRKPAQRRGTHWAARLAVVLAVFTLLACAGFFLLTRLLAIRIPVNLQSGANMPGLNPLEALYLDTYLGLRADDLKQPMAPGAGTVTFEVAPGSTAASIGEALERRGLVRDAALFRSYVRYVGLDGELEAGNFELSAAMTIPEIAHALTEALSPDRTVQIIEGLRMEEIAALIDAVNDLNFTGADFLARVGPGAARPPQFDFLASVPAGASLEGFLFPDTYRLAPDATAADLRDRMLGHFGEVVMPAVQSAPEQTLTLYEAVSLASIVEREAVIPAERPLIAGVYLNRLAVGMTLDADPTVQYAMASASPGSAWWPTLTQADYQAVVSPYNTYLNTGLPPGPIANPGLASIKAVIAPQESDYLYFRACDSSGYHQFSEDFETHLAACD